MGILNLMPCQDAPAIASLPHFYLASEELLEYFDGGVSPDKEKHNTFVYLEPVSVDLMTTVLFYKASENLLDYESSSFIYQEVAAQSFALLARNLSGTAGVGSTSMKASVLTKNRYTFVNPKPLSLHPQHTCTDQNQISTISILVDLLEYLLRPMVLYHSR